MQCQCGGETSTHNVVRNKKQVGEFEQCRACGRICWIGDKPALDKRLLPELG